MNSADTAHGKTRFSLRSLFILIGFAVLALIALNQNRKNQQMQRRLDLLSSEIQHLRAVDEHTQAKFEQLRGIVSNEPVLKVPQISN